jgi:pyruvate-ferredoxin/flavodoxin oxidoreductase
MTDLAYFDGNEAEATCLSVNNAAAIYPITPSSPMGEFMDQWVAEAGKISGKHTSRR